MFPELVGKWYTKTPLFSSDAPTAATPPNSTKTCTTDDPLEENSCEKWCYCQAEEWGTMIGSDNEGCAIFSGFTSIA